MRIAINTRFLLKNKLEGIGWYTYNVSRRLVKMRPNDTFIFLFDRPFDQDFVFAKNVIPVVLSPPARHPILFTIWFEYAVVKALEKYKADVFFSPDNFCSLRTKRPTILVVHDLAYLHFPEQVERVHLWYYRYFMPKFLAKAQRIITVSEATKKDIQQHFPLLNKEIIVSGNGCRERFKPLQLTEIELVRERYSNGAPYFFYVGAVHPRKNVHRLITAFDQFKQTTESDVQLLIAGRFAWQTGEVKTAFIKAHHKNEIHFLGYVSDEELPKILGAALALTYVSLFEGFGVPLLEAMKTDVPIITSNISSMPEVVGEAAILVNPESIVEIKDAMKRMYENEDLRNSLIEKGRKQSEKFSWERATMLVNTTINSLQPPLHPASATN